MSKATDRIKEMRKQNNMKNNNTKKDKLNKLLEKEAYLNEKYDNPTYEEIKAIVEKHRENGTIYATRSHDEAFTYLHNMKYTVAIIATYSRVSKSKYDDETSMCVKNIYAVVRETGECMLVHHAWINEGLAQIAVGKYVSMYKDQPGGEVFIPRLKTMKYAKDYRKNGAYDVRYQLSAECKQNRALWVKQQQEYVGINMTIEEIRAML